MVFNLTGFDLADLILILTGFDLADLILILTGFDMADLILVLTGFDLSDLIYDNLIFHSAINKKVTKKRKCNFKFKFIHIK